MLALAQWCHNSDCCNSTGLVVAADSTEGSDVSQSNQQFSAQLAARDASDRFTTSTSQTLVTLKKHREVQSGSCSSSEAGCQANRWYMEDSYAALGKSKKEDTDEQLGSVLPSGQSIATGMQQDCNAAICWIVRHCLLSLLRAVILE